MKKRLVAVLLCMSMAAGLVLTGCGNDSGEEKKDGEKEDQTITFYGFSDWMDTEPFKEAYEEAKAEFEEENPGYTVELQSDPWGDWEQKYKTMFASGNPADVFMVNNPDFPVFANSGNLLDLGEYTEDGYFDQFFPGVMNMYRWKEKNMAVPFTTDCRVLWYNKDIFEEAGLDPEKPPQTWDELVAYANQITEKTGKYGFGMDMGLKELPTASLFCASGSQLVEVDSDGKITPNVDTDEFRKYIQTLIDMKGTYEPDYATLDHHDVSTQFVEGQFGMIISSSLSDTDVYETEWWGQALVPTMTAETEKGSFGGGFGICVSSETEAPEAAVKFAQKLCDPEINAKLMSDIPASEEGMNNSDYVKNPDYSVITEQIQYTKQSMPKTLYYSEIEAAAYDAVTSIVIGGADMDETIKGLEDKINEIVSK